MITSASILVRVALGDDNSLKKHYLEKVGSNPQLAERVATVSFKKDWQILAEFNAERRARETIFQSYPCWLSLLNKIFTHSETKFLLLGANFLPNETRRMKPSRRRSLTLAAPQKNTLCSFHFARAGFLFPLMKRVFFCGALQ